MKAITTEEAGKKAKMQIAVIIAVGMLLAVVDMITSSDESIRITESYGQLYMIRPEAGTENGYVTLRAEIEGKNQVYEEKINVMLEPYGSEAESQGDKGTNDNMTMSEQERIDYEMRTLTDSFNSDSTVKKVRLPESLDSGEKISWEIEKKSQNNTFAIMAVMMLLVAVVYKNRFAPLKKRQQENLDSVIRQLPEFINRLVLLLNAGLVLSSAFEKTIEESMNFQDKQTDYFYTKMKEVYTTVKTANGSMHRELRRFARESGSRELMRISNIISDNVSKGVELTSKLQNESELLWLNRKKICEEKGRLAETKLTMPLVIFLMALIVITVSPALLEL